MCSLDVISLVSEELHQLSAGPLTCLTLKLWEMMWLLYVLNFISIQASLPNISLLSLPFLLSGLFALVSDHPSRGMLFVVQTETEGVQLISCQISVHQYIWEQDTENPPLPQALQFTHNSQSFTKQTEN